MLKKCCGMERNTRYCADCGKTLQEKEIYELLDNCRKAIKAHQTEAKRYRREGSREDPEYWEKRAVRADEIATKWQRWTKALEEMIARDEV